jgi:hypothetical protein
MKNVRTPSSLLPLLTLLLAASVCSTAQAGLQWKWRDANGAVQYSDRPPPAGTPEQAILSRPAQAVARAKAVETASAASAAAAPSSKASDPELEARRKKAEEETKAKQKSEEQKQTQAKAENCERARSYQRSLNDGIRIVRTNAKGEREFLDDNTRAEEQRRAQEVIQNNCK